MLTQKQERQNYIKAHPTATDRVFKCHHHQCNSLVSILIQISIGYVNSWNSFGRLKPSDSFLFFLFFFFLQFCCSTPVVFDSICFNSSVKVHLHSLASIGWFSVRFSSSAAIETAMRPCGSASSIHPWTTLIQLTLIECSKRDDVERGFEPWWVSSRLMWKFHVNGGRIRRQICPLLPSHFNTFP